MHLKLKLKAITINIFLALLVLLTWGITVLHLGVFTTKGLNVPANPPGDLAGAVWIPKEVEGINHLILFGDPFTRGYAAGKLTSHLIYQQEQTLIQEFNRIFPNPLLRTVFILGAMRWFWGIQEYFEPWMVEESYGVSLTASEQFNFLLDNFSRQIAYHGIHEVGQMMIDRGRDGFGCTVFAVPYDNSWIIGRNFDFEGGRIFDEEKVIKWVFPNEGYAFVSVIWAGMVGAVTGVNEHGVYISLNAAGSDDFSRYGTPSSLVLLKALQFSKNAEEATQIIENSKMFITDIFVIADDNDSYIYIIEKSPERFQTIKEFKPTVIANHLIGETWGSDKMNEIRKREQTTLARSRRGEQLLSKMQITGTGNNISNQIEKQLLAFLRDKNDFQGRPHHLGNRQAIDSLIASHSVIYNGPKMVLYVSQGPAVSGPLLGYDLRKSFEKKTPVKAGMMPGDPLISKQTFHNVKDSLKLITSAKEEIKDGDCDNALSLLQEAGNLYEDQSTFYRVSGDFYECKKQGVKAKELWKKALSLNPAYLKEKDYLLKKLSLNQ